MENFQHDWTRFSKRIPVKAPVREIYDAWCTQAGLENWFLRLAEFKTQDGDLREIDEYVQRDDRYRWRWHGYPDEVEEKGLVLKANGIDLFQFSFAGECTVTISITQEEGESIVELVQENIPLDEKSRVNYYLGCMEGWTFYLANLKSMLEGGIDLRNKNIAIQKVLNS